MVDIEIEILKDEVQGVALETDFVEAHDVRVRKLEQRLNLLLVDALVPSMVFFLHLFDSNDLT